MYTEFLKPERQGFSFSSNKMEKQPISQKVSFLRALAEPSSAVHSAMYSQYWGMMTCLNKWGTAVTAGATTN